MAMTNCPKCETQISDTADKCPNCGVNIILKCPECGEKIKPSDNVCSNCGYEVHAKHYHSTSSPPVIVRSGSSSVWMIIPAILGIFLIGFLFYMLFMNQSQPQNSNVILQMPEKKETKETIKEKETIILPKSDDKPKE